MKYWAILLVMSLAMGSLVLADIPQTINYQGRLTDDQEDPVENGDYMMTFTIYDAEEDGTAKWSSSPVDPVSVHDGFFNYLLGSATTLPSGIFSDTLSWLEITVAGEIISPRARLITAPYAYHSLQADSATSLNMTPSGIPYPCNSTTEARIFYHYYLKELCFCDGSDWMQVDGGGRCNCIDWDGDGYDNCDPENPDDTDGLPADCDDDNDMISPGTAEICDDGLDNDCDGFIDCNDPDCTCQDNDQDGYGSPATCCSHPEEDCDDWDAEVYPGALEVCDEIDNDCDGAIDEGVTTTYYIDVDGDDYGDPEVSVEACSAPLGYVEDNTDCDDANSTVNPGAVEVCDEIDNNCNGAIDEGVTTTYYADYDGDDYGDPEVSIEACSAPVGYVEDNTDCNDENGAVNPGATEICDDGLDNNCNGYIDCDDYFDCRCTDNDHDGYGTQNMMCCQYPESDCDDGEETVNPGAVEECYDDIDNDCDMLVDCDDPDCDCIDNDLDGYGSPANPWCCLYPEEDCDDWDANVYPGATEICDDDIDNDCDGLVDGDDPDCQ